MSLLPHFSVKFFIFLSYVASVAYIHYRGEVKLKFFHQLTDHSSLMAPINAIMYLFSAVPRTAFLPVETIPALDLLKQNWQTIRQEAQILYDKGYITASDKLDDIGFNSFFRRGWKRFYLKWYDAPLSSAQALCPKTVNLIQQIPEINAAMFTLLPKQSFLFEHRDPYAGSLRYHLGLITPNSENCCIYVDGKLYFWRDGEDVLFDETFVHSAKNTTEQDRIILFCDIKRPLKTRIAAAFNRFFSRTIMKAASSKNLPTESVGFINKLFKYLYQIRILGKRIKQYNQPLYYCVKYTLMASLLWAIFFAFG